MAYGTTAPTLSPPRREGPARLGLGDRGEVRPAPLVSRDSELRHLLEVLQRPDAGGVVLTGVRGTGRTRLLALTAERLTAAGLPVELTTGLDWTGAAAPGRPDRAESADRLGPPGENGADGPRLLLVDDAHLLDDAAAFRLRRLVGEGVVRVALTVRTPAVPPDPVTALWKEGLCERLELRPLSRPANGELVRSMLGGDVEGRTLASIWRITGGVPLYAVELVRGLAETGALQELRGVWRWSGRELLPPRVTDLVRQQVARLDSGQRRALDLLALEGRIGPEALEGAGVPVSALEELELRGLIQGEPEGRRLMLGIADPVLALAVRTEIGLLLERNLARSLADAVAASGMRRRRDHAWSAVLTMRSGREVDPEAAALGARHALGDGMWDTAESLGRAAIAAGDIGAVTILAQAVAAQGRTDEADALLTDALPQAEGPTADRIRLAQAMNSRWFLGDSRRAVRIVQEMQEAGGPAGVDARLLRARFDLYDADFGAALATAGAVLESEPEGSPRSLSARAVVIPALASLGRSEQAVAQAAPVMRDLALGGFAAYARVGRAYWGEELMQGIFRALTLHGSFDQAERLADFWLGQATSRHCLGQGEGQGGLTRAALWKVLGAEVKLLRGRAADALDLLHDAELRGPGPSTGLIAQLTATAQTRILAAALLQTGRPDAALSMLDAVDDVTARTPSTIGLWIGDGAGLALASHGRTSAGLDRVRAELARARAAGAWAIVLRGLHEIARTGPSVQLERYELAMLDRADGPLARARAAFVRAASARDAAGLEAAGRQFADLGAYLYAAEAAAAAMRVHDAAARYAEARYAAATARSWLEKCDVATSPLTSMLREPLQLTDRQREIARLAASGLASKVIAKRLVLSVRTVDNYLGQVYRKLGINNRQELSKIMGLE